MSCEYVLVRGIARVVLVTAYAKLGASGASAGRCSLPHPCLGGARIFAHMEGQSSRQRAVLEELIEWYEDIGAGVINSRVVLLEAPSGWGATTVLREFAATVADPDGPVAVSVGLDQALLAGQAADAKALSDALLAPLDRSRLSELLKPLGLDTAAGKIGLALGVGGLFVSGMAVQLSLLLTPYAVNATQYAWDAGRAGQQGAPALGRPDGGGPFPPGCRSSWWSMMRTGSTQTWRP